MLAERTGRVRMERKKRKGQGRKVGVVCPNSIVHQHIPTLASVFENIWNAPAGTTPEQEKILTYLTKKFNFKSALRGCLLQHGCSLKLGQILGTHASLSLPSTKFVAESRLQTLRETYLPSHRLPAQKISPHRTQDTGHTQLIHVARALTLEAENNSKDGKFFSPAECENGRLRSAHL